MSIEDDLNKRYCEAKRIINEAQHNEQLVLFVGAGASRSAGMPSWNQAVQSVADKLGIIVNSPNDFLRIPQYYYNSRGKKEYSQLMQEVFMYRNYLSPQLVHDYIIKFNTQTIVTTNYDNLIEQAAEKNSEMIRVISKDSDLPYRKAGRELIKIHGDFENDNFVLKEEDYLKYSQNFKLIENYIKSIIGTKVVLFIGYSFNDPDVKQIFSWAKNILNGDFQPAYLIETGNNYNNNEDEYFRKFGVNVLYSSVKLGKDFCCNQTKNLEKMLEWLLDKGNRTTLEELHDDICIFKDFNYSYSSYIESTFIKNGFQVNFGYISSESFPNWTKSNKEKDNLNCILDALACKRFIQKPTSVYVNGTNGERIKYELKKKNTPIEEDERIKDILSILNKSSIKGIIIFAPVSEEQPKLENELLFENCHRIFIDFDEISDKPQWMECVYHFDDEELKGILKYNNSRLNENTPELYMEQAYIYSYFKEYLATYNCLKTAASLFYRKNKKVKYFIAETNRFYIGKIIKNSGLLFGISQKDLDEITKEVDSIELERTYKSLTNLKVNSEILREISSFDISYKLFQKAFKISEDITEQANTKYNFFSGLPAFSKMRRSINDFYCFEALNYILLDEFNENNQIYKLYFQSLLTSALSPDLGNHEDDELSNVHIDSLSDFELFLGLKYVSYNELQKKFLNIDIFNIDEDGKSYLKEVIKKSKMPSKNWIFETDNYFWKIILMLGHVDMDQSLFDEAIARLCRDAKGNDYQKYKYAIIKFIDNAENREIVSSNNIKFIHLLLSGILNYLKDGNQLDAPLLSQLTIYLARLCKKYNCAYDDNMVINKLVNEKAELLCLELYPFLGDKAKKSISEQNNKWNQIDGFDECQWYCVAVIQEVIIPNQDNEKRILEYCKNEKEKAEDIKESPFVISYGRSFPNYIQLLRILCDMYLRNFIVDKEDFLEFVKEINDPFSTWITDIEHFDYSLFNIEWINYCYDSLLEKIGENNVAKAGISKKISEEYELGRVNNRIMRKYFRFFA